MIGLKAEPAAARPRRAVELAAIEIQPPTSATSPPATSSASSALRRRAPEERRAAQAGGVGPGGGGGTKALRAAVEHGSIEATGRRGVRIGLARPGDVLELHLGFVSGRERPRALCAWRSTW
jgi:hypothetical protein